MIDPRCCRCRQELHEKGGIVLTAPLLTSSIDGLDCDLTGKLHVCRACMVDVLNFLRTPPDSPAIPDSVPDVTHVLFEGQPLCGFMAGRLPRDWPMGHRWVSIAEVTPSWVTERKAAKLECLTCLCSVVFTA